MTPFQRFLTADDDEDDGLGLVVGACIVGTSAGLSIVGLYYLGAWLFAEPGRPGAMLATVAGLAVIVWALGRMR